MTRLGTDVDRHIVRGAGRGDASVTLSWASESDTGHRRQVNEDSLVCLSPVFAVADGMGGHSAGDLASAAAVRRLAALAERSDVDATVIREALMAAAQDIDEIASDLPLGAGTTVAGAVLDIDANPPTFTVFNVGDSRVYRLSGNELVQVTHDHSVVQELVDAGFLSEAEAEGHPESNVVTRALGFREAPRPDYWSVEAVAGLRLLICSDGLTKELDSERIRMHLAARLTPAETAGALVDAALAEGGRDNVTVVVVDVVDAVAPRGLAESYDTHETPTTARG